jgi:transcriptional regulator with XRE-family HTH domain
MVSNGENAKMSKRKTRKPADPMTAAVRQAIEKSGLTRYEIAKLSGVTEASLSRFANGQRGLNLASLDRLAPVLGLRIEIDQPKRS